MFSSVRLTETIFLFGFPKYNIFDEISFQIEFGQRERESEGDARQMNKTDVQLPIA